MGNGLIQVVAGMNVKYIDNIPYILLGLKPSGQWEFPGGKVENEERHYEAMEREWVEELGVLIQCDEERFGHARNGEYELWFYEVDIVDNEPETEPVAKEHIEVKYFKLDEVGELEMNEVNRVMMGKLVSRYVKN
jgi:8-oxo-dGTP pyrophosphatase MutT (NUDIX family)